MSDMNTVKNWSYPFKTAGESGKEVTDPQVYFDALAQAENGFYPMGKNGLWHGGVHFDDKTAALLDQSSVRCIADGEVIAYRIDKLYPKTLYSRSAARGTRGVEKDFSTGFVLVKHRLALPPAPPPPAPSTSAATTPSTGTTPAETSGETVPEASSTSPEPAATEPEFLTFYSLYMHLLDLAGYEANPALQRPAFWDAGLCKVKSDAPDKVLGLNVREHHKPNITDEDYEANNAKYENKLTTLPRGSRIETGEAAASPNHNWRRLIRATPAVEGLAENTGWVYVLEAKELAENHYLVSEDKSKDIPALEQIGLHVRESANATSNVLAVLPRGTEITVSGEGKYVKLETIVSGNAIPPLTAGTDGKLPGYVWLESLEAQRSPNDLAKDKVYPLAEAQSIKAGELIGHMGLYQEHDQEGPTSRLHLEVFSCEDVPAFIEKSKQRAASLPNDQKTLILVDKKSLIYQPVPADTQIAAEHDVRAATDSPTEGCWVKVHPYVVLKAKKADFGSFDGTNNRYPMGAAKKAELASEFDLDVSELPDTVDFLLESYKEDGSDMYRGKNNIPSTHVRRKVGIKLNTPVWVKRSALNAEGRRISTTSTLEAWESFPLSQATDNSQECGFARILSKASWGDLNVNHKAVNADTEKTRWWYVTVANEAGQDISGWVPEVDLMVTQHSPWGWPGFSYIQDTTTLVSQQAQSLSAQGELSTEESQTYAAIIDEAEHGEIFQELFKIIDQPNSEGVCDKKLTSLEIKNALGKSWLAQQLSLLITHYESEWFWKEEKWDELDSLMAPSPGQPNFNWEAEKTRIKALSWWDKLAGKHGINTDGKAWHFHSTAVVNNFIKPRTCNCNSTVKVTKWRSNSSGTTYYGPVHWGTKRLSQATQWIDLLSSGQITEDNKEIICIMTENEGKIEAVQSYDSEIITAGAMQKTINILGTGEFPAQVNRFKNRHPDSYTELFESQGWHLDPTSETPKMFYRNSDWNGGVKLEGQALKNSLRVECNESNFNKEINCPPVSSIACAISSPEYIKIQITDYIDRLNSALSKKPTGYNYSAGELFKTKLGKALVLDQDINRPGNVKDDLKTAVDKFHTAHPTISKDISSWGDAHQVHEQKIIEYYGPERRMTEASKRYEKLKQEL